MTAPARREPLGGSVLTIGIAGTPGQWPNAESSRTVPITRRHGPGSPRPGSPRPLGGEELFHELPSGLTEGLGRFGQHWVVDQPVVRVQPAARPRPAAGNH